LHLPAAFRRYLAVFTLAVASAFATIPAGAQSIDDLTEAVPDIPGKKWLDLLRQLFPGAVASDPYPNRLKVHRIIAVRSLGFTSDQWMMCGEDWDVGGDFGVEAQSYRLAGKTRTVVLLKGGDDCADIAALFDEKGKLVDAVNVKGERYTVMMIGEVRPLGRLGALLTVESGPEVTGKAGSDTAFILIRAGGFAAIGTVHRTNSRTCREEVGEGISIDVVPEGGPLARINVEQQRFIQQFAEDCKTKLDNEAGAIFKGYWRWDAAKGAYEPHLDELKTLADWNEKHF
jgi:hypothetical protein